MISVTKTVIDSQASDGTFQIKISNHENIMREAIYSEIWPWWVKGWMSEMAVWIEDEGPRGQQSSPLPFQIWKLTSSTERSI